MIESIYLSGCIVHDFLCGQITFVADEQLVNGFTCVSINLLEPLFDVVERLLICHVVHDNDAMCATVITAKLIIAKT